MVCVCEYNAREIRLIYVCSDFFLAIYIGINNIFALYNGLYDVCCVLRT